MGDFYFALWKFICFRYFILLRLVEKEKKRIKEKRKIWIYKKKKFKNKNCTNKEKKKNGKKNVLWFTFILVSTCYFNFVVLHFVSLFLTLFLLVNILPIALLFPYFYPKYPFHILPYLSHTWQTNKSPFDACVLQVEWIRVLSKFGCASYMWCLSVNTNPCLWWGWVLFFERFLLPWYIINFDMTTCLLCLLCYVFMDCLLPWDNSFIFHLSFFCIVMIHWKYVFLVYTFLLVVFFFSLISFS